MAIHLLRSERRTDLPLLPLTGERILMDSLQMLPYVPVRALPVSLPALTQQVRSIAFSPEETTIRRQMLTGDFGPDSTSYQALDRNLSQWPDAVLVCDLTTSMYPYSTQLFAWLRQHAYRAGVAGIVFFTDCDSLGQETQPGVLPGRMYVVQPQNVAGTLPIMLEAARNTINNHDDAENDVEALLFAQKTFPAAKHLVLVADNMSQVKDLPRLKDVRKPVHVVLCGTTGTLIEQPFQTDFLTIASSTGGSLHTLEDDLDPDQFSIRTVVRVGPRYYRYNQRKKRFQLTQFNHRPIRILGFLWL